VGITSGIKEQAYALGYDLCGVIQADAVQEYGPCLDKRIERFPQSRQFYERLYPLASPDKKGEWAKSIIVGVRRYNKYKIPTDVDRYFGKVYLFDGRLSFSKEHNSALLFEEYLKSLGVEVVKDAVVARLAAVKAGLGHFGKNNFLYTKYGSWVWIDTWTVNLELDYDAPVEKTEACPKNCRKCIDACPTGALCEPYAMDPGLCIAKLSFFSSELPPDRLKDQMGAWLYGCDVCQNVCPKNKGKWVESEDFPGLNSIADLLAPDKIAEMDEETYVEKIQPRFWYIGKEGAWLWKSNAIRAMANSTDEKYHKYIRQARRAGDERVRAMADWACGKMGL